MSPNTIRLRVRAVTILAWAGCMAATMVVAAPAPVISASSAGQPPRIDGRLDDPCWQGAAPITSFLCVDAGRPAPTQRTEAWVACDADAIYLAARCFDDHMGEVQAVETGHDGRVWRDDCLEVFLMPGSPYYYHLGANLLGTRYDARHSTQPGAAAGTPESWNGEWSVAAQRAADCWTMELAIPLACLEWGAGRIAAPLRLNIGREQRRLAEFSCWPASGFNKSEEFAVLTGVAPDPQRYGLVLKDTAPLEPSPGPNRFAATVAEEPSPGVPITVRARVQPATQEPARTFTAELTSRPGTRLGLDYQVPVSGGRVAITFECLDAAGKVRLSRHEVFRVPAPLEAALDLPLLYRSDGEVRLAGRVALPPALRGQARLQAALTGTGRDAQWVTVPLTEADTGAFRVQLPVGKLPPGRYAVETRLTVPGFTPEPVAGQFPFRLIAGPWD